MQVVYKHPAANAKELIISKFKKAISQIKTDWQNTRSSWTKTYASDPDFFTLLKFTLILILLFIGVSFFANTSYFNFAFYFLIVCSALLFFTWLGYLAKTIGFGAFGFLKKGYGLFRYNSPEWLYRLARYKLTIIYIRIEYATSSFFAWPPDPKNGESDSIWLKRIKPMQAYRVERARYKMAKNYLDLFEGYTLHSYDEKIREKFEEELKAWKKSLLQAETGMKKAIKRNSTI